MSILDELDELHNLQDIEKEASLASLASSVKGFFRGSKGASGSVIHTPRPTVPKLTDLTDTGKATATSRSRSVLDPNMRVVSRAERRAAQGNIIDGSARPVSSAPSAGRSASEESGIYGRGPTVPKVNRRAPEVSAPEARVNTAEPHIASDTFSSTRPATSAGPSYGNAGVNAGPGFSGKVAPPGPISTNLKTSFTQAPAGVSPSTATAASAEPTSNLFGKIKDIMTKERHVFPQKTATPTPATPQRRFPKGETLESRRAWVEKNNPSRATVREEMPRPGEAPKAKENTESDTPTKWYKDKNIMKGVGIGAVGAGAVGLGAHMLNQKAQSQDSGTAQGYY